MSLSFPLLFSAIPLEVRDVESSMLARRTGGDGTVEVRRVWLTDGGLSSNFPIHLFDALLPGRPTFAMSLDDLPAGANPAGERVTIPKSAKEGFGLPVHEVPTVGAFVSGILGSAKDWQDNLLAGLPGQRERIARVLLSKSEGGLNLAMPSDVSKALMGYGQEVGQRFAEGALDFDEHRWRRGLVAYEQLESSIHALHEVWEHGGYDDWWRTYSKKASSYGEVSQADRRNIRARLDALAGIATVMSPRIKGAERKMPRPEARLRIGPNV